MDPKDLENMPDDALGLLFFEMLMLMKGPPPDTPPRPALTQQERDTLPIHAGHTCPNCRKPEWWCDAGHARARHSHKCRSCGQQWQHEPDTDEPEGPNSDSP